jgi:hypothetical protein
MDALLDEFDDLELQSTQVTTTPFAALHELSFALLGRFPCGIFLRTIHNSVPLLTNIVFVAAT